MIKIIQEDTDDCSANFLVADIQTNILNALRRVMIADLGNHAFHEDNTVVSVNTSLLHNEILRHRLSLVPLNTTTGLKVNLNVSNTSNDILNIYSGDLEIIEGEGSFIQDILLYKLKKNQEINLTATSDYNCSKVGGTIYKPIITSFFKIVKQLSVSNNVSKDVVNKIYEYLIEDFELFEDEQVHKKQEDYNVVGLLHTVRSKSNFVKNLIVKFNLNEDDLLLEELSYNKIPVYSFTIESIYISPANILKNTLLLFKEKLDLFWDSDMEVEEEEDFVKFFIQKESPTLLNSISNFLRQSEQIYFAHYNKLHPLDDFIVLQLSLHDVNDNYVDILKEALINIDNYIQNILTFDIFV